MEVYSGMEKLGLNTIREKYLSFFESKGHLRMKSFPLIPQGDKGLLIINSGMAPLKPYFSGEAVPPSKRVTSCQKCIRTPDIELVGKTSRHGTFFEMLGNFSFGDYFKREACTWAWAFITEVLEIPEDRLHVSVYLDDDEAYDIWTKEIGVKPGHIVRLGKADNFWEIGAGPCGPCTEIYFDRGAKYSCGKDTCAVGCDCDRYVEFWNLVFTQYYNDGNGNYTPLANKNIDTGMGLERISCIMQGVESLFDVDTISNILKQVSEVTGVKYGEDTITDTSLRIITDHIRSATMMIGDGIIPSNEGRGYVLRRLIRRAARHGKLLGLSGPFLHEIFRTVVKESKDAYPELEEKQTYIGKVILAEEERFGLTIDSGMKILSALIEEAKNDGKDILEGTDCFKLYDTYGFPIDLTVEILEENGMKADINGFNKSMNEQKERARAATAALGDFGWEALDLGLPKEHETLFTGYESVRTTAQILAIIAEDELCSSIKEGQSGIIVLDKTPFYAEMGGQAADHGIISSASASFGVNDVHKTKDGKFLHSGTVISGELRVEDNVIANIDEERRRAIMRAHSATHLLHKALKNVLGPHVEQAGSLVVPDVIRFDFTHYSAISPDDLERISTEINDQILLDLSISMKEMRLEEAKKEGASALFGEKYADVVRVIKMGSYSTELCGGTHLSNTARIGSFIITSEFSVAAGVRRIEAVVGKKALELYHEAAGLNKSIAESLKTSTSELKTKVDQYLNETKELKKTVEKLKGKLIRGEVENFLVASRNVKGLRVVTSVVGEADADWLRSAGDFLRDKSEHVVAVLASVTGDKITFISVCGKRAIEAGMKAGELIKLVTGITGGSGGGKPDVAMGGGKNALMLDNALAAVDDFVSANIKETE